MIFKIEISSFQLLEDEIESLFIFEIKREDETILIYKLQYSCNPFLDVELFKMNKINLNIFLNNLNKMIFKKEYPHYILTEIIKFRNYLNDNFFSEIELN